MTLNQTKQIGKLDGLAGNTNVDNAPAARYTDFQIECGNFHWHFFSTFTGVNFLLLPFNDAINSAFSISINYLICLFFKLY